MTWSLAPRERTLLLLASAAMYAAWIAGVDDRLDAHTMPTAPLIVAARATAPPAVARVIRRDPFSGAPDDRNLPDTNTSHAVPDGDPLLDGAGSARPHEPLVPNLDTTGGDPLLESTPGAPAVATPPPSAQLIVRATVVGSPSLAYIQGPEGSVLVHRGDRIAGVRVVAIDLRGVTLSDGTRLDLTEHQAVASAFAAHRPSIDQKIDQLRRLVGKLVAATAAPAVIAAPASTPAASEAPVTPGPLPTIVPRALPVGVSPTANAYGPTPYPVPDVHTYLQRTQW